MRLRLVIHPWTLACNLFWVAAVIVYLLRVHCAQRVCVCVCACPTYYNLVSLAPDQADVMAGDSVTGLSSSLSLSLHQADNSHTRTHTGTHWHTHFTHFQLETSRQADLANMNRQSQKAKVDNDRSRKKRFKRKKTKSKTNRKKSNLRQTEVSVPLQVLIYAPIVPILVINNAADCH